MTRRFHVLIVDDNPDWLTSLREIFEDTFSDEGIELVVDTATTASDARRILRDRSPMVDMVVSDILLPSNAVPGAQVARLGLDVIKAAHSKSVPLIIGYTTMGHPDYGAVAREAREEGAHLFFQRGHFASNFSASPFPDILESFRSTFDSTGVVDVSGSLSIVMQPRANDPRRVAVVHGVDSLAASAMFEFLTAIRLDPVEWREAVRLTGLGSPVISDVVRKLFDDTQAVIVMLTPDERVEIAPRLVRDGDTQAGSQPRPNVFIEAGMALALNSDRTIFVRLGATRNASDLQGLHAVTLDGTAGSTDELVERLETAGCPVQRTKARHNVDFGRALKRMR